jgi:large subunit ribosomal protein L6
MSRIGRMPIAVASSVQVSIEADNTVTVKGPTGQLQRTFPQVVTFEREDGKITVVRPNDENQTRALHGLSRTLFNNMVVGVTDGFTKVLEVQGVGYRAQMQGSNLQLALGFSHPVVVPPPAGISFAVEGPRISISGIDKEQVGQVAANVRKLRPPEPYKGKGIRYQGEYVRRKAGKSGKGAK